MTFTFAHHSVAAETSHSPLPSAAYASPFYKLSQTRGITTTRPSPHHGGKKCEWTGWSQGHGQPLAQLRRHSEASLDSSLPWSDTRMAPMPQASVVQVGPEDKPLSEPHGATSTDWRRGSEGPL